MYETDLPQAHTQGQTLADIRRSGARLLAALFWVNVLALAFVGWLVDSPNSGTALMLGAAMAMVPSLLVFAQKRFDTVTRIALGMTAGAYPAVFVYLMQGHEWQMDLHMYFFPVLAALIPLCDKRPILAGAGLIAVHHLLFNFVAPEWVFAGSGDLPRVILHAVLVILQTAALLWVTEQLTGLILKQAREVESIEALRAEEALRLETERKLHEAEAERRKSDLERRREVAEKIEARFGQIVTELGATAAQLSAGREALVESFGHAVAQSDELDRDHRLVSDEIDMVGKSVQELADSVRAVGDNATAAREAAMTGAETAERLAPKVGELAEAMDEATRIIEMISNIANQSRMLALNATIEASHEGSKGFGVVATEMKSLADQTAQAANQIADMLGGVREASISMTESISETAAAAGTTRGATSFIVDSIDEQVASTQSLAGSAHQVARNVANASDKVQQLTHAIGSVEEVIEQTNGVARLVAERSSELHETMREVLEELRAA
ncbi:methyl-accepting chemotaxis protein [Qipengyuania sphaerica]|uniref:methyl-accepting chemotaxis protein n=1 Tax=Qipengyuania sphaerica TaxID=2867243 RepID=UPI001C868818|nr:chemotaxis protein [Qipengyuania sphaerica]